MVKEITEAHVRRYVEGRTGDRNVHIIGISTEKSKEIRETLIQQIMAMPSPIRAILVIKQPPIVFADKETFNNEVIRHASGVFLPHEKRISGLNIPPNSMFIKARNDDPDENKHPKAPDIFNHEFSHFCDRFIGGQGMQHSWLDILDKDFSASSKWSEAVSRLRQTQKSGNHYINERIKGSWRIDPRQEVYAQMSADYWKHKQKGSSPDAAMQDKWGAELYTLFQGSLGLLEKQGQELMNSWKGYKDLAPESPDQPHPKEQLQLEFEQALRNVAKRSKFPTTRWTITGAKNIIPPVIEQEMQPPFNPATIRDHIYALNTLAKKDVRLYINSAKQQQMPRRDILKGILANPTSSAMQKEAYRLQALYDLDSKAPPLPPLQRLLDRLNALPETQRQMIESHLPSSNKNGKIELSELDIYKDGLVSPEDVLRLCQKSVEDDKTFTNAELKKALKGTCLPNNIKNTTGSDLLDIYYAALTQKIPEKSGKPAPSKGN